MQEKIPNLHVRTSNAVDYACPAFFNVTFQYQTSLPGAGICAPAFRGAEVRPHGFSGRNRLRTSGLPAARLCLARRRWRDVRTREGDDRIHARYSYDNEYARGNKTRTVLGLTYQVTPASAILAAVANMHSDEATIIDAANHTGSSAVKLAVGYEYSLAKRTLLHLHYAHVTKPLAFIFLSNTNKVMLGIEQSSEAPRAVRQSAESVKAFPVSVFTPRTVFQKVTLCH